MAGQSPCAAGRSELLAGIFLFWVMRRCMVRPVAVDAEGRGAGLSRVTISIAPHSVRGEWGSEQFFCFAGKIQRNIGDRAVRSIPALGKADGVFRVVFGDIPLKGRCGLVFASFCLHGNDFRTVLQQKVNFSSFVRVIARFYLKLPAKLLQDIVLGQRPFELIVRSARHSSRSAAL